MFIFFLKRTKPNDSCTITYTLTFKKDHFLNACFFSFKNGSFYTGQNVTDSKQIVSSTFSFCLGKSVVGEAGGQSLLTIGFSFLFFSFFVVWLLF